MIVSGLKLLVFASAVCALKYDPDDEPHIDEIPDKFEIKSMEELYSDWDSIQLKPDVNYFATTVEELLRNGSKELNNKLSGEVYLSHLSVHGFENQKWQYWSATDGTASCDSCVYKRKGDEVAERFYGGFSTRLRSLLAKVHVTLDGKQKQCDLIGLTVSKNSVAHHSLGRENEAQEELDYMRLFFDFAFIWSPPIGVEIKNWSVVDDWPLTHDTSRYFLETMRDNDTWPQLRTRYHSPLFNVYVDPKCLELSYQQTKSFNLALSKHLDRKVIHIVKEAMRMHFLVNLGQPYAQTEIMEANGNSGPIATIQSGPVAGPDKPECSKDKKKWKKRVCKCLKIVGETALKQATIVCVTKAVTCAFTACAG